MADAPFPWIADTRSLAAALAAVDVTFLNGLRELDLPDSRLRDWLAATAQAELDRRAGGAPVWPVLELPTREIEAARHYLASASAVTSNQRWSWSEDLEGIADARLLCLYLFSSEVAKAAIVDAQIAEPETEPAPEPITVAQLQLVADQVERLHARTQQLFETHTRMTATGMLNLAGESALMAHDNSEQFKALQLEIRDAVRALKAATESGHEVVKMEVRRWAGKPH